ncbi:MAG: KamA family radical SAM protein [Methanomicrobiales archaeon]|nr:KamA family radical SAM protein [Methanomicrobiales archaeon]
MKPRFINRLNQIEGWESLLSDAEREKLERVERIFPFRSNDYYLSLIDWEDRGDPIRRIVLPDPQELENTGRLDPSSERSYTRLPGLQHKYPQTALVLFSDTCGGICRFCFRKRLFLQRGKEVAPDIGACIAYIRAHPEITDVLLSGGDPLMLPTGELERAVCMLREIEHVQIIRIGSKIPAYNPYRILNDPELIELFRKYSSREKKIYLMTQFNHPRELTGAAIRALDELQRAGAMLMNQTPILAGINDAPETLAELLRSLSFIGVAPYYLFQCRPAIGNRSFTVPVERSLQIVQEAFRMCSGLAKRARFVMSHATGKIEVVGSMDERVFMRYHQAARSRNLGRLMAFSSNPDAIWFDDYLESGTDGAGDSFEYRPMASGEEAAI